MTTLHTCEPAVVENAMIYSDNIYFAKAALKIGAKEMESALNNLGFYEELPFEIKMTESSYSNTEHIETEIQLADSGYGQGQILVNPLHMASIYTAFCNEGNVIKPYLLYKEDFKRTTFQNLDKISEEVLIEKLSGEYQALCIVNTKKKAQALYQTLKGQGVFHLSTSMYPKHRKRVLEEIRRCLNAGERCLVLSTSLVEAGVDLDFHSVYRQLAGIDSVIQAAGRCNREGKRSSEDSSVYVFQFEAQERVLGQRKQIEAAKVLVSEGKDISALESIEEYFEFLYHLKSSELDKKNIMEQFKGIKCDFPKVAEDFKMIENDTKTVFIPIEEEAQDLLQQLKYQGFTKTSMRKAGQYSVTLYDDIIEKMEAAGMIEPVAENITDFYELKDKERYSEEFGLDLNVENGMALFW